MHLQINLVAKEQKPYFLEMNLPGSQMGRKRLIFLLESLMTWLLLKLSIYHGEGNYKGKLLPISCHKIEPAYVICPPSFVCGTASCNPRSLVQHTWEHDIPMVTLIKGHTIHQDIPVLTGKCPNCATLYTADHEKYKNIKVQKSDQTGDWT